MTTNTAITRINPTTLPDAGKVGYSQITTVEPGRLAFISGQVAWRRDGGVAPGSLNEQAAVVMENARAALDAIHASVQDLVVVRVYVVQLKPADTETLLGHLLPFFNGVQPSLTVVGVTGLAAADLLLEMEMVVRVPA